MLPDISKIWICVFNTPTLKCWESNSLPHPCTLTTNTWIQQNLSVWPASFQSQVQRITREVDACLRNANLREGWAEKAKYEESVASNSFMTSHRWLYTFRDPMNLWMNQSRVTRKDTTATKTHTRISEETNGKGGDVFPRCLTQAKWVYFEKRCKQNIQPQGGETQVRL